MKGSIIIIFLLLMVLVFTTGVSRADYRPVFSGKFEAGDRLYTEVMEDLSEERVDEYFFRSFWLKYRQQLDVYEYYYFRIEYEDREYIIDNPGNSSTLNLWGNYTYYLKENIRNRWEGNIRDKKYVNDRDRAYRSLRLKYQLDYEHSPRHDYSVYLQRQIYNYNNVDRDNTRDRISCTWNYEVNSRLNLDTTIRLDREQYEPLSGRSNKYGRRLSLGFDFEL
ncbi:MAG: hypothetical protein ACOCZM_00860 [Bacillota bacterium]